MITSIQVTEHGNEFFTEASMIGLQVGNWPKTLETSLGNGKAFVRLTKKLSADGDLMYVRYRQNNGRDLLVFND